MNADKKRKVFEELLEEYQNHIESEFSYEDGEREAERKAWLNKYDGIKEPLIKDEKIRKAVRAWADINNAAKVEYHAYCLDDQCVFVIANDDDAELSLDLSCKVDDLKSGKTYTITELCGKEEE